MPKISNTLGEKFVIEFVIMPVIREYCVQFPVKIDYLKLAKSPHYIPISLLAFMRVITEINISCFNSIPWRDIALLQRIQYLQNDLCTILEEETNKVETDVFKLQVIDEQISIAKTADEQLHWDRILPRYRVSPVLAKLLLDTIIQHQIQKQRQKKYEEEKEEQIRSINKLHRQNLAQRNLKAELSNGVRYYFRNTPVQLVPDNLPETIWLKDLAHYLAISERGYQKYGDVIYDDEQLLNNARGTHKILRETANSILNIILNERCKMPPTQYEAAKAGGVLDIAVVAILPEREISDDWSILVTKELALRILKQLPEFNYLFDDIQKLGNQFTSNKNSILRLKTQKAKTLVRTALEAWVTHLIETNICTSFGQFENFMTHTYYKKNLRDEGEKYDYGPRVKKVFCLLDKDNKHKVYFKIENDIGITGSINHRALSSFKDIFDTVIDRLKQPVT